MCYEDKLNKLADAISPFVQFDSVDEATEYSNWYRLPNDSELARTIEGMAELLHTYGEHTGIKSILDTVGDRRITVDDRRYDSRVKTQMSLLRQAIKLCADRYIEHAKITELVELGEMGVPSVRELAVIA